MFYYQKWEKRAKLVTYGCSGDYQDSFFNPFNSSSDAKKNLKELAVLPIINLSLALHATIDALVSATLGLANIVIGAVTFDLNEVERGGTNLVTGAINLVNALYYSVSIIIDTLETLIRLVTHSLTTVAFGVQKTKEAISECFNPMQEGPEIKF